MNLTLIADIVGLTLSATFLLIFAASENKSNRARYLVIAWMTITFLVYTLNILILVEKYTAASIVFLLAFPMFYCVYPVADSYINSLISRGEKIEMKLKSYSVPVLIFTYTLILLLFLGGSEFKEYVLSVSSYSTDFPQGLGTYIWIIYIVYYLQFLYFMKKFIGINRKYKNDNELSFIAEWVKYVIFAALLYEILLVAVWYIVKNVYLVDAAISNLMIVIFGIIGFKHDDFLYKLKLKRAFDKIPFEINERKIKSKLDTESQSEIVNQIKSIILREKLYLNPHLKIRNFAKRLHLPEKELSILINDVLGMNFTSFVNEYRIKEACILLKENELKISEIPSKVGFFSRSAFNAAFKEITGLTPTIYRAKD